MLFIPRKIKLFTTETINVNIREIIKEVIKVLSEKQKKAIEELHQFLNEQLEIADKNHQETLKRHQEIMDLIDKAMAK